jgi:23S rRNA pseudouridine1911/1915/1917 synthase
MQAAQRIEVPGGDEGARLDVFLARHFGVGRRFVWRLLERDAVELAGRPAAKGAVLHAGDVIDVAPFRHPSQGPIADPELALEVLAESAGLIAVDKPAGVPSHPLEFDETGTALGAVLALRPGVARAGEGGLECGLVHRLDTFSSGVLVFATGREAWVRARAAFSERRVRKRYLARVHGQLREPLEIRLRLAPRGDHVRVVERGGRESHTRIRALRIDETSSLLEVEPISGLRHQIRAVLAHLGHPIQGDALYGSPLALGRHLLHAERIELDGFVARSPLPPEFGA